MAKNNPELGREVNKYLDTLGINTPITEMVKADREEKLDRITDLTHEMLEVLGLDLTDDSLEETPLRVAKMYVDEIFSGLRYDTFPKCTTVENKFSSNDEFVLEKNITLYSDCEHHLRPIIGHAHIAYIPGKKVLGLSKLNRVTQYFAQRPQVQERLTQQIAHAIAYITDSKNVMVVIDAGHTCVSQRGIKDTQSTTVTATCLGVFGESGGSLRKEVMANINRR
ncbi:MAG: GTP cyclohydrolase I FolE [Muricauda sp. TMED12]|nr:MAG: GTP cyclohydrolase I FolE [Muricauda sp. TMED12]|tara:strand:- start:58 stop:729 length:672 start_codon:yes stop_codon:yes gene_type:complete